MVDKNNRMDWMPPITAKTVNHYDFNNELQTKPCDLKRFERLVDLFTCFSEQMNTVQLQFSKTFGSVDGTRLRNGTNAQFSLTAKMSLNMFYERKMTVKKIDSRSVQYSKK